MLRGSVEAGSLSLKLSSELAQKVSLGVGEVVNVISTATGFIIEKDNNVIAFVPNAKGQSIVLEAN